MTKRMGAKTIELKSEPSCADFSSRSTRLILEAAQVGA